MVPIKSRWLWPLTAVGLAVAAGLAALAFFPRAAETTTNRAGFEQAATAMSAFTDGGAAAVAADRQVGDMTVAELAQMLTDAPASVPEDQRPGAAILDRARLLLGDLGSGQRSIVAFPTGKGAVCAALSGFSAGCLDGFAGKQPVDVTVGGDPRLIVWGIASDGVTGVDVIVAGTPRAAILGANAYYFEAEDKGTRPEDVSGVVAHLSDGSSVEIPFGTG